MERIFLSLWSRSLSALWLLAAVLLLRLALKSAPKWTRCALWALLAIRLMCPVSLESALSLVPRTSAPAVLEERIELPAAPTAQPHTAGEAPTLPDTPPASANTALPTPHLQAAEMPAQTARSVSVAAALAWVWLAGMLALLLYALVSFLHLRRRVSASLPLGDRVFLCDDIPSPFILGIVRPRIYLPSALPEAQRALVLAHERAHLRRRDHWWKPLGWLLLSVYWFNPALWLAYALLCRDIELAADERVLRELGTEAKKPYSEALLECSAPQRLLTACPLAFGEVGVGARIRNVLNYKKPAFWLILLALLAAAAAAVFFLTDRKTGEPDDSAGPIAFSSSGTEYTVAVTHEPVPQERFSDTLREALVRDWASYAAMSPELQAVQSKMPGHVGAGFATWAEAVHRLGFLPDNPLEADPLFEKKNTAGTDIAENGVLLHAAVNAYGDADGAVSSAGIEAGYRRGGTRVMLRIVFDTGEVWSVSNWHDDGTRFESERRIVAGDDALIVRPVVSGSAYEQATVYLLRGSAVYIVHCVTENGADELSAAVEDVLAAFGASAPPEGLSEQTFTDLMGLSGVISSAQEASGRFRRSYFAVSESGGRFLLAESFSFEPADHIVDLDGDGVTELVCNQTSDGGYPYVSVFRREGVHILRGWPDRTKLSVIDWDEFDPNFTSQRYRPDADDFELQYRSVLTGSGYNSATVQGLGAFSYERYGMFDPDGAIPLSVLRSLAANKPLRWDALRDYPHTDVGSGLYIPRFQAENGCTLTLGMMGAPETDSEIASAWLRAPDAPYENFDLLSGTPEELDAFLAQIAQPSEARTRGTFTGILGTDGYWEDVFDGSRTFRTRSYYAVGGDASGGYVKIAESFGYGAKDYARDLDGDGVNELICCNTYGGDGAQRITVYRANGGKIEAGTLDVYRLTLPGWNNWSVNSYMERFDEQQDALIVRYDKADGTTGEVRFGMEDLTFGTYLSSDPRTAKEAAPDTSARENLLRALRGELLFPLDVSETRSAALSAPTSIPVLTAGDGEQEERAAFAFVDLDGDGAEEAVYRRGDYRGFYVLRWWNGAVYGYEFNYRGLMELKQDGTFRASGGAGDNGCGRLRFFGTACEADYFLWLRESGGSVTYTADGEPVSRDDYLRAAAEQDAKRSVIWQPYETLAPATRLDGTCLVFRGERYDLRDEIPAVNSLTGVAAAGQYLVVEGHINPQIGAYGVFDAVSRRFVRSFTGTNLTWLRDDLKGGVYESRGTICRFDGSELAALPLEDGEFVRSLELSEDGGAVSVLIEGAAGERRIRLAL